MTNATSIIPLLKDLRQHNPSSPRLIWYGTGGERVELSGRVLDNWVAKTSNLLADELDAEAGSNVLLDMAPHWRSLSWALACWQVGAILELPQDEDQQRRAAREADVVVTTEPERFESTTAPPQYLVAVALGALQMRWDGPLPSDAVDYAGEVRSHPDEFFALSEPAPEDTALHYGSSKLSYGQLFTGFARDVQERVAAADGDAGGGSETEGAGAQTVLVSAGLPMEEVLQIALGTWVAAGGVVLVHPEVEVTDSLIRSERVTRRFGADPNQYSVRP